MLLPLLLVICLGRAAEPSLDFSNKIQVLVMVVTFLRSSEAEV